MLHLDILQRNNLLVGNLLAAERPSSLAHLKAFVSINAYLPSNGGGLGGRQVSIYLNAANQDDILFVLRAYEVDAHSLESGNDFGEDDLINSYFRNDIATIEALEIELGRYLDDFSRLKTGHRSGNPL